jgi:G:T/U-mismatch repair DNA glycosylase
MQEIETHPWKCFAPKNSKILVVGTFPTSKRNWKYDFFYPNTANLFWKVMAEISKTELRHFEGEEAVLERKMILQSLAVAITDMGKIVIRHDDSSNDEKLIILE